ncbi:MAG: peptide ABC transporter substrate-binding protein [Chloroflexi bacterium]|nr:peptide ABC transporter substrate-binding protein [Chloroflexota bacterium]
MFSSRNNTLRWQMLLAFVGFGLVLAILSFQIQQETAVITNGTCTTTIPTAGGDFIEGVVGAPRYLNPLLSDAYPVDREMVNLLFDGLTTHDAQGRLVPALAEGWTVSENGRSVQFTLREGVAWHDGMPVTATDVAFTYGLIQDETFSGLPEIQPLWQSVTISVIDERTVAFQLAEPYAPFLEETTRGILPAHLLEGVTAVTLPDHPFNQNPIGTGPFKMASDQNWQQTSQLLFVPNETYWQQDVQLTHLGFRFFPDEASRLAAFENGEIYGLTTVPDNLLPDVATNPISRLETITINRYSVILFNQSTPENQLLHSVDLRRALAYGLDRTALIDDILNGQGVVFDGPYLPDSWVYNPTTISPINFNPISATLLLDESGWLLPEGMTVRQQEDESLTLQVVALNEMREVVTAVTTQWAALGIGTETTFLADINDLQTTLSSGLFDIAFFDVVPSADPDLYDFWSQEAMIRGQNYGQWNNRRASEALEGGRQLWRFEERLPFYDTFQRIYDAELPALSLYQHVSTYAIHRDVNLADIGVVHQPRDRYKTFDEWFLQFEEVAIPCAAETDTPVE